MVQKDLLPNPEETIGFVAYRTSLSMKQYLLKNFKENGFDITVEQWGVMYRIFKNDGLSQNQIAEKSFKQGPNITRIIDDLEEKGLVLRSPDANDRRKYLLFLTDKGSADVMRLMSLLEKVKAGFSEGISQEDMFKTIEVLNKIYHNINSKEVLICT